MRSQTHLYLRDGAYYFRRRIPQNLREHFKGKAEVRRALGTRDPREARRRVREMSVAVDLEFAAVTKTLSSPGATQPGALCLLSCT